MKPLLNLAVLLFTTCELFAQGTVPAAQGIPYSQDFSTLAPSSAVYPAGWQGWQLSTDGSSASFRTTAASANFNLLASSTASSTGGGVHNYNGKLGLLASGTADPSLCLSVNTTGKVNIVVTFDIATIRNPYNGSTETRRNNVELQYRVGAAAGSFTSLTGSIYRNKTTTQTSGIVPRDGERFQFILPAACENQSAVQLRWVQRDSSGAGSRPSFSIDNVIVCPAPIVNATVVPACSGNNGSIALSVSAGLPPYTFAWDTLNKGNGPVFAVTTATKTSQHPYFGVGFSLGYVLDGIQGKELNLTRGVNYVFSGTFPGHPFHISSSASGGSFLNEVSSGVTNSQLQGGALVFTPNLSHPSLLYYQCGFHLNMGWRINISNGQLNTPAISGLSPGKYSVAVSSADGCITTLILTVPSGTPPPPPDPVAVTPLCEGSDLELSASNGVSYTWTGPAGFSSNDQNPILPGVSILQAGFYAVTASSASGCTSSDSVEVQVLLSPGVLSFTPVSGAVGTFVDVSGSNLLSVSQVTLGPAIAVPSVLSDTSLSFAVPPGAVTANLVLTNADNCQGSSSGVFTVLNVANLNLKCYIEGFYAGGGQMSNPLQDPNHPLAADTLVLALYDSLNLGAGPQFTSSGTISVNGTGQFIFPAAVIGNRYYIVIRHRSAIETWSKYTFLFSQLNFYDFSQ